MSIGIDIIQCTSCIFLINDHRHCIIDRIDTAPLIGPAIGISHITALTRLEF